MQKTRGKTDSKIPQKRKRNEKPVKPAMKTKLTGQKVLETSQNRKKSSAQMLVGRPKRQLENQHSERRLEFTISEMGQNRSRGLTRIAKCSFGQPE
jgi:hypothetical protein